MGWNGLLLKTISDILFVARKLVLPFIDKQYLKSVLPHLWCVAYIRWKGRRRKIFSGVLYKRHGIFPSSRYTALNKMDKVGHGQQAKMDYACTRLSVWELSGFSVSFATTHHFRRTRLLPLWKLILKLPYVCTVSWHSKAEAARTRHWPLAAFLPSKSGLTAQNGSLTARC